MHYVEPKKSSNSTREEYLEVKEKKISQEDVKKLGYQINLSFRVKGLSFDNLEKVRCEKEEK